MFKHRNTDSVPKNKILEETINLVIQFANSLPKVYSHYCRFDTSKMEFDKELYMGKMFCKFCEVNNNDLMKKTSFTHEMDRLNSGFWKLKKDQCKNINYQ